MTPHISKEFEHLVHNFGGYRQNTWMIAAKKILEQGGFNLIETGCFRGTLSDGVSTLLLAQLSKDLGGWLDSYELSPANINSAKTILKQHNLLHYVAFHEGDSITNLAARNDPVHFAYLDSYDCGLGPDFGPCQRHQLAELEAVLPLMTRRSVIMLDDHVVDTGGKTKLSMERLDRLQWNRLATEYQVVYSTDNAFRFVPHNFCVLAGHLSNYAPMAARTIYQNRGQYCFRYGYDLRVCRASLPEFQVNGAHVGGYSYSRLKMLLRMAESSAYEWIWCVGCDTLVTNFNIKLEDIIADSQTEEAKHKPFPKFRSPPSIAPAPITYWRKPNNHPDKGQKHVILCGEAGSPTQADSFLVRCSPEGIDWLRSMLCTYHDYRNSQWVENQAMNDYLLKYAAIIHIIPQHRLNAYDYSVFHSLGDIWKLGQDCYGNRGQWEPGDFVVHWPAQTYEQRMAHLDRYEPQVIK